MANFVWTGVLYFSTLSIVYLIYRVFVVDRQAEFERKTRDMVSRSFGGAAGQGVAQAAPAPQPAHARFQPPKRRQSAAKLSLGSRAYRP